MKRLIIFVFITAALAGCGRLREVREIHLKDGTVCAVTHNNLNGNDSEPHCNWKNQGGSQ